MDSRNRSTAIDPGPGPFAAAEEFVPFARVESIDASLVALADKIGFGLFLLATAALLLRPADSIPALHNAPIYYLVVLACLCLSVPRLVRQLAPQSRARPITQLIFGFWICIILSHLARGSLWDMRAGGVEFFKLFIYYLLILAWVDSPARMRQFMLCLCACSLAQTIVGLLEYDGWINLSTLRSIEQVDNSAGPGAGSVVRRLCGIGIFDDPNDLCLLLVTTTALCFGFIGHRKLGRLRFGWLLLLGFSVYTIALTRSRSGLLSLVAMMGTLLVARYGRARALAVGAVLLPMMLVAFAGRQTHVDLSDREDTFQTRLDCWADSLDFFKISPLFGIGEGQQVEQRDHVAHNSFIQSFAELGFAGGACFLGVFVMAVRGVQRTNVRDADGELARLRPVFLAIAVGYAIGLLALSRAYSASTYLIVGLIAAYINLTPRVRPLRLDFGFVQRLAVASVLFIAATYLFVRFMSV
jgi:putative inorganic carbon (hco3(-)) transporter